MVSAPHQRQVSFETPSRVVHCCCGIGTFRYLSRRSYCTFSPLFLFSRRLAFTTTGFGIRFAFFLKR